jgi:hypothetical protein
MKNKGVGGREVSPAEEQHDLQTGPGSFPSAHSGLRAGASVCHLTVLDD